MSRSLGQLRTAHPQSGSRDRKVGKQFVLSFFPPSYTVWISNTGPPTVGKSSRLSEPSRQEGPFLGDSDLIMWPSEKKHHVGLAS